MAIISTKKWNLRAVVISTTVQGTESREESKSVEFATNWINGELLEINSRQQKSIFGEIFNQLNFLH